MIRHLHLMKFALGSLGMMVGTIVTLGCSIDGSRTHGATLTGHDVSALGRAILLRSFSFNIFSNMKVGVAGHIVRQIFVLLL